MEGRLSRYISVSPYRCLCVCQSFLYLVWYTTMSILGHYNNFFFAAHLLDIAMGFKTLRTILSSVTHNGKQVRKTESTSTISQEFALIQKIYINMLVHSNKS